MKAGTYYVLLKWIVEKAKYYWAVTWWKLDPWKKLKRQRRRKRTSRITLGSVNDCLTQEENHLPLNLWSVEIELYCDWYFYCYYSKSCLHVRAQKGLWDTWQNKCALEQCWSPPAGSWQEEIWLQGVLQASDVSRMSMKWQRWITPSASSKVGHCAILLLSGICWKIWNYSCAVRFSPSQYTASQGTRNWALRTTTIKKVINISRPQGQ